MTLLSTSQEILRQTKSSQVPDTIIDNLNDVAVQILAAMKVAIVSVARDFTWQQLEAEHTFNSVASTEAYALPSDFDSILDNTFWNVTNTEPLIGAETSQEWRVLQNSTITASAINDYYRIRGNQILIFPTPSSVEAYIFEYKSNLIVDSSGGTGQTGWLDDSDVPNVDEYLVKLNATWRFLKMQGKPYAEEQRDYDLALIERTSKNGGNQTVAHAPFTRNIRIGYPNNIIQ